MFDVVQLNLSLLDFVFSVQDDSVCPFVRFFKIYVAVFSKCFKGPSFCVKYIVLWLFKLYLCK